MSGGKRAILTTTRSWWERLSVVFTDSHSVKSQNLCLTARGCLSSPTGTGGRMRGGFLPPISLVLLSIFFNKLIIWNVYHVPDIKLDDVYTSVLYNNTLAVSRGNCSKDSELVHGSKDWRFPLLCDD